MFVECARQMLSSSSAGGLVTVHIILEVDSAPANLQSKNLDSISKS